MITKDPSYQDVICNSRRILHLSFNDVKAANTMYKCAGNVKKLLIQCPIQGIVQCNSLQNTSLYTKCQRDMLIEHT